MIPLPCLLSVRRAAHEMLRDHHDLRLPPQHLHGQTAHREGITHPTAQRVAREALATGSYWCRYRLGRPTLTVRETKASATHMEHYDDSHVCQEHEGRVKML